MEAILRRSLNQPQQKSASPKPIPTISLDSCLAKTRSGKNGRIPGRTVEVHCRIAGEVAKQLLGGYYSKIVDLFPPYAWIAALLHDIGKVSPTFQKKIYAAIRCVLPELEDIKSDNEYLWGGHAAISHGTVFSFSDDKHLAEVVGNHHGRNFTSKPSNCYDYGGEDWENLRKDLVRRLIGEYPLPKITSELQEILVLGIVVLADWIASGEIFDNPEDDWPPLVPEALHRAGFVIPSVIPNLEFAEIFSFDPNNLQKAFLENINGPGIYVLEAPMGLGKTEAALAAAYKLIANGHATGIYFGLPTQLTSNMIHSRVNAFLEDILADDVILTLVHGNARLKKYMDQQLGADAEPGESWFDYNKRGLLAPFSVGTLDQALLSVMRVRHAALRALGLAGKVVILDEVHSYDAYTGELLDLLVNRLRDCGCTVIILSATLTSERRQKLLNITSNSSSSYPLLTLIPKAGKPAAVPLPGPASKNVSLHFAPDDSAAVEEALLRAEKGEQVLWIENTVGTAQEKFRLLAARAHEINVECGLLHSRFTPHDREKNEKYWTGIYGKESPLRSNRGRILVGTQVLEQSLDLDADFLVTRLCPTDMLLQRMGRLWRHERADRARSASRETWILAPDLATVLDDPKSSLKDSGTSLIYSPYVLGRTLEAWNGLAKIVLPDDIRELLEKTYSDRPAEPSAHMEKERHELENMRKEKRDSALAGASLAGKVLDDDCPGTRLVEQKTIKLLLLQDINLENGQCICADGTICALSPVPAQYNDKARIAAALAMNTASIPIGRAPRNLSPYPGYMKALAPYIFEAKKGDDGKYKNELIIALLADGQNLADVYGQSYPGIHYSSIYGYYYD